MSDVNDATTAKTAPTPDDGLKIADGPVLAADGTPLKKSLSRALRVQKLRALALVAPLLIFVLVTFIAPIADMLFRSVENEIVSETLPRTTDLLADWDAESGTPPGAPVFKALFKDIFEAQEAKLHTRLGSRLNYELTGVSSLFRKSGRKVEDMAEVYQDQFEKLDRFWKKGENWNTLMGSDAWNADMAGWDPKSDDKQPKFELRDGIDVFLPATSESFANYAKFTQVEDEDNLAKKDPWALVYSSLYDDLQRAEPVTFAGLKVAGAAELSEAASAVADFETVNFAEAFTKIDKDWQDVEVWRTIQAYSPRYTNGYFLNAIDMQKGADGPEMRPENQQIYLTLFWRTMVMSIVITVSCILLGYPVAWLLANLPARTANLLMILVLLPFWTSLLVRTSAWKVMLQHQGVVNETLVWLGIVATDDRLALINNQTGTIIAMTHILLPFMILPLYSVMATVPQTYLRAAKSLGATNWTAFWRVYFPQSVPGIGAGSILVFILSIGYYITPEIVGGTSGTFISNRIAYHISSSLNWGLGAALGAILLAAVLLLYYAYDKIVGIDNVKLGG
ncbi:putative spermidine/putrescine transport system permease protein [Sulfitobacter brevis]|uniref:Putative spermidine/putrescine transport system permease protein n=1 Tax=Sulfitobacter brevis TaxID=74348 RepID=A0A1I2E948_9RHOB|nr:ABC transporter permease [Sulfitobacter brevis]SFE89011.1 putative spermidine/putrescine transport system permease protein [Sulfitobacter brevis]